MPKIAITGKGGVGKTTLTALLSYVYTQRGQDVIAIDADPAGNLGLAFGLPANLDAELQPIAEMEDLIYERTGAQKGTIGGVFRLNPKVDDIPESFSVRHRGVRLLRLGTVRGGGAGCICPESALLKALVTHMLLRRNQTLILDMEAGVEHLGRGTAGAVDAFIIVVEPGLRSLGTAEQIHSSGVGDRHQAVLSGGQQITRPPGRRVCPPTRRRLCRSWAACRFHRQRWPRIRQGWRCSTRRPSSWQRRSVSPTALPRKRLRGG